MCSSDPSPSWFGQMKLLKILGRMFSMLMNELSLVQDSKGYKNEPAWHPGKRICLYHRPPTFSLMLELPYMQHQFYQIQKSNPYVYCRAQQPLFDHWHTHL